MAEGDGLEPSLEDPKSSVLPLDDPSMFLYLYYSKLLYSVNNYRIEKSVRVK